VTDREQKVGVILSWTHGRSSVWFDPDLPSHG